MPKSKPFVVPESKAGMWLVGINPCECVTAVLAPRYSTEKDVRDFYVDMAKTAREVRWMEAEEARGKLSECSHKSPDSRSESIKQEDVS